MKIKELHLTNFRGFEQLDIVFPNRLAVFIGVNGAGKSAVLDAISTCFFTFIHRLFEGQIKVGTHNIPINEKDIRNGDIDEFKILSKIDFDLYSDIPIINYFSNKEVSILYNNYGDNETDKKWDLDFLRRFKSEKTYNLPIFLHLKTTGIYNKRKYEDTNTLRRELYVYENAFGGSQIDYEDFVVWFRYEEDKENEKIIEIKNFDAKNPVLQTIRKAVSDFFSKMKSTNIGDLKIERSGSNGLRFSSLNDQTSLTIQKGNTRLLVEQLSDGEKKLLTLVCDIARRLTIANPSLENPLEGEGIVLIDEIDLHLHPQWQREVIPALLETFPKLQFIVTTHSPQVLSKVKKESIFILEDGKLVKNVPNTYGRNASAILFEIFGVTDRPAEVQDQINRCSQLLEEENYDEAKALLKELTELLGENDEAVIGAKTQLLFDNQMMEG